MYDFIAYTKQSLKEMQQLVDRVGYQAEVIFISYQGQMVLAIDDCGVITPVSSLVADRMEQAKDGFFAHEKHGAKRVKQLWR